MCSTLMLGSNGLRAFLPHLQLASIILLKSFRNITHVKTLGKPHLGPAPVRSIKQDKERSDNLFTEFSVAHSHRNLVNCKQ